MSEIKVVLDAGSRIYSESSTMPLAAISGEAKRMSRDDVIRWARQAGFTVRKADTVHLFILAKFSAIAFEAGAAAEREAILKHATPAHDVDGHCEIVIAADIRARGKQ